MALWRRVGGDRGVVGKFGPSPVEIWLLSRELAGNFVFPWPVVCHASSRRHRRSGPFVLNTGARFRPMI